MARTEKSAANGGDTFGSLPTRGGWEEMRLVLLRPAENHTDQEEANIPAYLMYLVHACVSAYSSC